MGAYGVLLLRMTQKRFSATQYALFSSLFGLPRLIAGPITGLTVHAVGWTTFFWCTMAAGIPGLLLLWRFVPPGTREPTFAVEPPRSARPLSAMALLARGVAAFTFAIVFALALLGVLDALETWRRAEGAAALALGPAFAALLAPTALADWLRLLGAAVFAVVCGLFAAAVAAARHGAGVTAVEEEAGAEGLG
jgi:PAT family beta-lactamase induction signal transducer AmpG